jgi:hypothetical protein
MSPRLTVIDVGFVAQVTVAGGPAWTWQPVVLPVRLSGSPGALSWNEIVPGWAKTLTLLESPASAVNV